MMPVEKDGKSQITKFLKHMKPAIVIQTITNLLFSSTVTRSSEKVQEIPQINFWTLKKVLRRDVLMFGFTL